MATQPAITADPHPATLGYAHSPPTRKRMRRVVVLLGVLLSLAAAGWRSRRYGPQAVYLYHQSRCMNAVLPANQVVYDNDPKTDANLIRRGGEYHLEQVAVREIEPPEWKKAAAYTPGDLLALGLSPPQTDGSVVFMGRRQTPSGTERLVVATARSFPLIHDRSELRHWKTIVGLQATAFRQANWQTAPRVMALDPQRFHLGNALLGTIGILRQDKLRVFAGQADAADLSHFTCVYTLDGQQGTIQGWLRDPGGPASTVTEWVELQPTGPLQDILTSGCCF